MRGAPIARWTGRWIALCAAIAVTRCEPARLSVELPQVPGTQSVLVGVYGAGSSSYARLVAVDIGDEAALAEVHPSRAHERRIDVFPSQCTLDELGVHGEVDLAPRTGALLLPETLCVFSLDLDVEPQAWAEDSSRPPAAVLVHVPDGSIQCPLERRSAVCALE